MKKKKIDDKTGQVGEASYHFFQTKNCHVLKRKKAETKKFRPKFKLDKNYICFSCCLDGTSKKNGDLGHHYHHQKERKLFHQSKQN